MCVCGCVWVCVRWGGLQKRSQHLRVWSTRYFVLQASPPRLLWHASVREYEDGLPPRNCLELRGASVGACGWPVCIHPSPARL